MKIVLPTVIDDFDGQCAALDNAILTAAGQFNFVYEHDAPHFETIYRIPEVIYELIRHYTLRGFNCTYDGDIGKLRITWDHPNMSWIEKKNITRAVPEMIDNLGIGFRASLVYLCMTNGEDLRGHSDITLQRELDKSIKKAATLGNTELAFGFPAVPAPVIENLFKKTFDYLTAQDFIVLFNANTNLYLIRWGNTFKFNAADGQHADLLGA